MFKRFTDAGFGVMERNKFDFEYWVSEFNLLRKTITIDKFKFGNEVDFMDLFICKGEEFLRNGKLDISIFQNEANKYMYIPSKSGHLNTRFVILFWGNNVDTLDASRKNLTS